ncbi:MAG: hypothetical protein LUG12_00020 [Erysipelotrichaceae bacterium]|nr:hypothetical protein [Erysipelotrichaceae bacterium]
MILTKNLKVTVNNSVDAYVYLVVNDNTQGLVDYTIDDGWILLDGYSNVYYREVASDAENKDFTVLKNDTVSYSSELTNADMLDEDGNLKEDIELTFSALAIQKIKSNDEEWSAGDAYFYLMDGYVNDDVNTKADFAEAITNDYFNITVTENITKSFYTIKVYTVNGTINADGNILGTSLYLYSGTLTINGDSSNFALSYGTVWSSGVVVNNEGTVLNINGGKYINSTNNKGVITANTGATVNINGGYYQGIKGSTDNTWAFLADGGTIYVNDYEDIYYRGTDVANKSDSSTYKAINGGIIYAKADIFDGSISSSSQVSDSTVTINGTEYYVITEAE